MCEGGCIKGPASDKWQQSLIKAKKGIEEQVKHREEADEIVQNGVEMYKEFTDRHVREQEPTKEQMEEYFTEPVEEVSAPGGESEILHSPALDVFDGGYVTNKVERIIEKIPDLDSRINEIAKGWTTKRMGKVELTILRLALFEIQYDEDVPEKVAINEAVELAKKFGGDDSPSFVNGILAKLV